MWHVSNSTYDNVTLHCFLWLIALHILSSTQKFANELQKSFTLFNSAGNLNNLSGTKLTIPVQTYGREKWWNSRWSDEKSLVGYVQFTIIISWLMMKSSMETFSASLAICAGELPFTGEFSTQRPVTRSFDVFRDLRLNKRLSKQSWSLWLETASQLLWRHSNVKTKIQTSST